MEGPAGWAQRDAAEAAAARAKANKRITKRA
jgi:hypothetical protein